MAGFGTETFIFRGSDGLTNLGSTGTAATAGSVSIVSDGGQEAFDLNGVGYINVSGITHGGGMSLGLWYRRNASVTPAVLIERDAYGQTDEFGLVQSGASTNGLSWQANSSFYYDMVPTTTDWEFAAATLASDGSAITYRNGAAVASGSLSLPVSSSDAIRIGSRNGSLIWRGYVDDVRFESNAVWSPSQIAAWYAGGRGYDSGTSRRRRVSQQSIGAI